MSTATFVFDQPATSAVALGQFPSTIEQDFAALDIAHLADDQIAFARTARPGGGRLIVDGPHAAAALAAPGISPTRIILLTHSTYATNALDAMEAGVEHVFLEVPTRRELNAAINGSTHELAASQGPRLADLGLKMATIAQEIETLLHPAAQPGQLRHVESAAVVAPVPGAAQVRALIRTRRARANHFSGDLFADPAWDILLDLMAARLEGKAVSVSSLCIAAAVPPTTALRWIKTMTDGGLLERKADPADGRRIFIDLTDHAMDAMRAYFARAMAAPAGMLAA